MFFPLNMTRRRALLLFAAFAAITRVRTQSEPQLLRALHCLHAHRLVHRDVKREHLLFSERGELRRARAVCAHGLR